MVTFTRVRLHQNFFFFSCAPKPKFLLLLVCVYIKMFSNSRLHPDQNFWFYSCAPASKCLPIVVCSKSECFPVLVFAYIENNVSLFLCASVSEGLLLLMSTFVFNLCNYSNVPLCVSFDFVFLHGL